MARHTDGGSGIGSLIKVGAFVGIGYYLYKNWDTFMQPTGNTVAVGSRTTQSVAPLGAPVSASPTVTVAPTITSADATTLRQKIQQYLATDPGFPATGATYDQWNWIRWKYMSAPESQGDIFPGTPQDTIITLDQYLEGLQAHGISGIRRDMSGLGAGLSLGGLFSSPAGLGSVLDFAAFYQAGPHKEVRKGNFR